MLSGTEFLSEETLTYIVMILIYSGVGSWLIGRLTRSREDERRAERARVAETLGLLDSVTRAREALAFGGAAPEQIAPYDVMRERLSAEAGAVVAELNMQAHQEHVRPSSRFVLIPTPLGVFGVLLTAIFCLALYFAFMMWLTLAFYIWTRPGFDMIGDPTSQTTGFFLIIGGLTLFAVAMASRSWAFERYDARHKRLRDEAAETFGAPASGAGAGASDLMARRASLPSPTSGGAR